LTFSYFRILLCCVLQAVFDTAHSETLLDLSHYHFNSVYVPWQSKGKRRTMTMQDINGLSLHHISVSCSDTRLVRRQATDFTNSTFQAPRLIATAMDKGPADTLSHQIPQADTQVGGGPTDQSELSSEAQSRGTRRPQERWLSASQRRYASPEARSVCDGWCKYSEVAHPNVVCTVHYLASRDLMFLESSSDLQSAWEGPNGTLTTVLCNYLSWCILWMAAIPRSDMPIRDP
jgi:hypothetical protein